MTSIRRTSCKRSLSLRSWFSNKNRSSVNHSSDAPRPICSLCGKYRSSRFHEKHAGQQERVPNICSRPTCARVAQATAIPGSSYVVEVHHYHHDHCAFYEEVPLTTEDSSIIEAPGNDVVRGVAELPTTPAYKRRRRPSVPLPTIAEEPSAPQTNRLTKPVFHPI